VRLVLFSVLCSLSSVLSSLSSAAATGAAAPADPDLNPKGRAILAYFQQLQASPELKLVSGQFSGWKSSLDDVTKIHRATGRWPAMIGLDYCVWLEGAQPDMAAIDTAPANQAAVTYWRAGGLVNLSWHAPNPSGKSLKQKGLTLAEVLTPGSPTNLAWLKSLDEVAAGLQELQAAGVVVLWRPLHEMNGGWFWWGGQDPADYIRLWRHMFDYFTHTKQLHNLIWVFGPNHGQQPTRLFYPGDAYVDVTGLDAYTDHVDPRHIKGFPEIIARAKPVGFTEFGPHGASNPPGDFDYRRFLDGIQKHFPQLRHFLCWDYKWNPAENKFAKEFYNDPRVITRETLPAGLAGK